MLACIFFYTLLVQGVCIPMSRLELNEETGFHIFTCGGEKNNDDEHGIVCIVLEKYRGTRDVCIHILHPWQS